MPQGPLIILSGPSGVGKSTVIRRLLAESDPPLHMSVSATTRAPRPGERDGVDYFFWTPTQFQAEITRGGFLEWAEVHGRRYGTLRSEVDGWLSRGVGVLLDIDVQGAEQVRRKCPGALSIFLKAPSWEIYEARLRGRHTENEEMIARRLATARREVERSGEYEFQVMNQDLDAAVAEIRGLIARRFERGTTCSTT
ncbi:MAG TPA: guanylate kinase [Gemmataceae bacterium]|nr:guanylate kinase [Gemmataceae bacterium]